MYWRLWNCTNFPSILRTLSFYAFSSLPRTGDFIFYDLFLVIGDFKFYKFCVLRTLSCYDVPMYCLRPCFFMSFLMQTFHMYWWFWVFTIFPCIGDFEFLQIFSLLLGTLNFYEIPPVLGLWVFTIFPCTEDFEFFQTFPPIMETLHFY